MIKKLLAHKRVKAMHSISLIRCNLENGQLTNVEVDTQHGNKTLFVDGIFVFMGQKPSTDMFKSILPLDEQGYIVTDENMMTSIAGVIAAGDVRQKQIRQITTAMSDGTIASLCAERYLRIR